MSKNLAKLLDQPERLVTKAIDRLEDANGYPSHDVRLLAENTQAIRSRITQLGLDPDDTTGEELHQALLTKFAGDSQLVDKALGVNAKTSISARAKRAIALITNAAQLDSSWTLKHSAAKKLLSDQPPKRVMKLLNYRSVDSLLKRENLAQIYLALPYNESASWQKNFAKQIAKLSSTDYELRLPEFSAMPSKWLKAGMPASGVNASSFMKDVGLWPSITNQKTGVLTMALQLLDGLESLTHSEVSVPIGQINPALAWWEQSRNLLADCRGEVVSLNYKDVAFSSLSGNDYASRLAHHGQRSLWSELASRYHAQSTQLEAAWSNLENDASSELNKLATTPLPSRMALEYSEI